ncbi:MAG TPA: MATE family efflux transporter [Aeriscardovia aeriphila]|uniref:Multidrug export protein MepA n=1 Tax=Aeriscardovia aeriphila TaxID=218139 RepID=A0A921FTC7_9BIFI|nr:MATE family efflux transporter [Aeriscardovia aeriphila]
MSEENSVPDEIISEQKAAVSVKAEAVKSEKMARISAKHKEMTQSPLAPLILRMAGPAILANVVSTVYSLTDTFYVGHLGTAASGAVGIVMPIMLVFQALGLLFGQGSGNTVAVELGKKNVDRAGRLVSVGFFTALGLSTIIGVLALALVSPLMRFFGATPTILPLAIEYAIPLLIVSPLYCTTFVMNPQLRFQGLAKYAMIAIVSGAVLNMVLEPIFIFVFHMGLLGAGIATAIAQTTSWALQLWMNRHHGIVRIHLSNYKPDMPLIREMIGGGIPSLIRNGMLSIAVIAVNVAANPFGDAAIAAMAIDGRIMTFFNQVQIGLGQGFQPVCGFNYGAHFFQRVRKGYWFVVRCSLVWLALASILVSIFAEPAMGLFRNDPEVIRIGAQTLRFQCLTFTLSGFVVPSNMMQQTIGHTFISSLVGLGRQGVFLVPALLILPNFLGLTGVMISQPVADIVTFIMTVPLQAYVLRGLSDSSTIRMKRFPFWARRARAKK